MESHCNLLKTIIGNPNQSLVFVVFFSITRLRGLAAYGLSGLGAAFCALVSEFAGFSATTV